MITLVDTGVGEQALRLAERGVAVVPGTHTCPNGSCSCEDPSCRAPGAHPADSGWLFHATTDPETVVRWWRRQPRANIVVPLLGRFHVVDAPSRVGEQALRSLGGAGYPGPVAVTSAGRYHFWVARGAAVELAVLLSRGGCSLRDVDLRVHREGAYVLAPPSRLGRDRAYRWERPLAAHVRRLPGSAPLLRLLTEICEASGARPPVGAVPAW